MWLLYVGLLVHLILISLTSDWMFWNLVTYNENKDFIERNGPAKRMVFILADGLEENHFTTAARGVVAEAMNGKGTWGRIKSINFETRYSNLPTIVSGFPIDPVSSYLSRFLFFEIEVDNILKNSKNVIYIGNKDSYYTIYNKYSNSTWGYFTCDDSSVVPRKKQKERGAYVEKQLFNVFFNQDNRKILEEDKSLIFINLGTVAQSESTSVNESQRTKTDVKSVFTSVQRAVRLVNDFYRDQSTAYFMCSTFKRNALYTDTYPFVAWGAGIASSKEIMDIKMIDVAAFVSTVLGLKLPAASRGVIPTALLSISFQDMAVAQACNAMHLYDVALKSENIFLYTSNVRSLSTLNDNFHNLLSENKYIEVNNLVKKTINLSQTILEENERFYKSTLWLCTILTSVFWLLILFSNILPFQDKFENKSVISISELKLRVTSKVNRMNSVLISKFVNKHSGKEDNNDEENNHDVEGNNDVESKPSKKSITIEPPIQPQNEIGNDLIHWKWLRGITDLSIFVLIIFVFLSTLILQWSSLSLCYIVLPIILFWVLTYMTTDWVVFAKHYLTKTWQDVTLGAFALVIFSIYLAVRRKYSHMEIELCLLLVLHSLVYGRSSSVSIVTMWLMLGCLIVILSMEDVFAIDYHVPLGIILSSIIVIFCDVFAAYRLSPKNVDFIITIALLSIQAVSVLSVVFGDSVFLESGYAILLKVFNWILMLAVFLPIFHGKDSSVLVVNICIALSIPLILLSTAFEPLFFVILSYFMILWMILEGFDDRFRPYREVTWNDARRSFFFAFFCLMANDILGNSQGFINSNINSIRNIMDKVYEPFATTSLVFKTVLVFIMMNTIFIITCASNGLRVSKGFNLILIIYHAMGMIIFFRIDASTNMYDNTSVTAATQYFAINVFIVLMIISALFSRYLYRLPVPK